MKMPILRPIPLKPGESRLRKWRVLEDYYTDLPGGEQVHIPRGFEFDGASVPRPLWAIFNPTGILLIPALIHDYAISYGVLDVDGRLVAYSYKEADVLFKKMTKAFSKCPATAWLAYAGVRIGSAIRDWRWKPTAKG